MGINYNQGIGFAEEMAKEKANSYQEHPNFQDFCLEVDNAKTGEEEDAIIEKYEKLGVVN
jgi:hypothetical protein